jgi:hypothetical protein
MTVSNDTEKSAAQGGDHPKSGAAAGPDMPETTPNGEADNAVLNLVVDKAPEIGAAPDEKESERDDSFGSPPFIPESIDPVYGRPGDFPSPSNDFHEQLAGGWPLSEPGRPAAATRNPAAASTGPRLVTDTSPYETLFGSRSLPEDGDDAAPSGPRLVSGSAPFDTAFGARRTQDNDSEPGGYETVFGTRRMPEEEEPASSGYDTVFGTRLMPDNDPAPSSGGYDTVFGTRRMQDDEPAAGNYDTVFGARRMQEDEPASGGYDTVFGTRRMPEEEPAPGGYETVFGVRSMPESGSASSGAFGFAGGDDDGRRDTGGNHAFESFSDRTGDLPTVFRSHQQEAGPAAEAVDVLADAVQSALRNIYGGDAAAAAGGRADSQGSSLGFRAPEQEAGQYDNPIVANAAAAWEGLNRNYSEDPRRVGAPEIDDSTTEAVLSYLYEHHVPGESRAPMQPSSTINVPDLLDEPRGHQGGNEAANFWRQYEGGEPQDTIPDGIRPNRGGLSSFGDSEPQGFPPSTLGEAGGYQPAQTQFGVTDIGNSFEQRFGAMMPQSARADMGMVAMPPATTMNRAAMSERESGRLLGAAGLGLIGGIALAGVLAAFLVSNYGAEREAGADPSRTDLAALQGRMQPADSGKNDANTVIRVNPAASRPTSSDPLSVTDVSGPAGEPVRLSIGVAESYQADNALVTIKGLPNESKLSAGFDIGSGAWLMPADRLDGLQLTLPKSAPARSELQAQLLRSDGRTAISEPRAFVVSIGEGHSGDNTWAVLGETKAKPAQAPGARQVALRTSTDPVKSVQLVREGNKLMRDGDILASRKLYQQAVSLGDPEAALAMGRSYDPLYFEQLQVKTGKPDPALAFEWYKKAVDGGIESAKVKIDTLKQWLLR